MFINDDNIAKSLLANLNNAVDSLNRFQCCIIIAFRVAKNIKRRLNEPVDVNNSRNRNKRTVKRAKNRELYAELRRGRFNIFRVRGRFDENSVLKKQDSMDKPNEDSFIVVNNNKTPEDFKNTMIRLGMWYMQDAIIITEPTFNPRSGKLLNVTATMYSTSPESGPVGSVITTFTDSKVVDASEFLTFLNKNVKFTFTSALKEFNYPARALYEKYQYFIAKKEFEELYPDIALEREWYKEHPEDIPSHLRNLKK